MAITIVFPLWQWCQKRDVFRLVCSLHLKGNLTYMRSWHLVHLPINYAWDFCIQFQWREILEAYFASNFCGNIFCFQFCDVNFLWHIFALNCCAKCKLHSGKLMCPCFLHNEVRCPCIPFERNLIGCTSESTPISWQRILFIIRSCEFLSISFARRSVS